MQWPEEKVNMKVQIFPLSSCLFPSATEDSSSNGMSGDSSGFEDTAAFPPPPPPTEISLLELPPKTPAHPSSEAVHIKELEIWPSLSTLPAVQIGSEVEEKDKGKVSLQNGQPVIPPSPPTPLKETMLPPPPPPPPLPQFRPTPDIPAQSPAQVAPDSPPTPGKVSPSPAKEGPPLPTKPKPKLWVPETCPHVSVPRGVG